MGKIFISYRREDSTYVTDSIYEKLAEEYGHKNIFKDVDNIPAGADFREYIDEHIRKCDNDFVRLEIDIGLKRGIPVVPILVDNVTMPKEAELPESLKGLSYRNALLVLTLGSIILYLTLLFLHRIQSRIGTWLYLHSR